MSSVTQGGGANILQPKAAAQALLKYCRANNWAGYDPYDALNSRILERFPVLDSRWPRIFLTQALKRSPLNLRRFLLIPKTQNPKAIALFLNAALKLSEAGLLDDPGLIGSMVQRLADMRSANESHSCWGYSFPWQTRTLIVPRAAPSLVCTTFAGEALLNAYEHSGEERCLAMALSAAEYILEKLYWVEGETLAGFSYPTPDSRGRIHNANFLGAAFLCRTSALTGERKFVEPALRVTRYSLSQQAPDGSWPYGELPTQKWIDNFHTGYNLCALRSLGHSLGTTEFESAVQKGYAFYRERFFEADGAPKYFHNKTYPIDAHCVAQSIITPLVLRDLDVGSVELAERVFTWAMQHLWDDRGFFYYRAYPYWRIKTSYMRWVQAWMLLAICTLASTEASGKKQGSTAHSKSLVS